MVIFRLIVMLENKYQIKINDNELFSNKFKNIKNISKLIEKKLMQLKKNKIWHKAKKVIIGGNSLLSKRPDLFLPDYWPTYYSRASGVNLWDINKKICRYDFCCRAKYFRIR